MVPVYLSFIVSCICVSEFHNFMYLVLTRLYMCIDTLEFMKAPESAASSAIFSLDSQGLLVLHLFFSIISNQWFLPITMNVVQNERL